MNRLSYILTIFCVLAFATCKEEEHEPLAHDDQAPEPITQIKVENLPGAVRLSYILPPNDKKLLYVKAEFETQGKVRDVRASYYNNELLLEGFGDTLQHEVKVYTVNRSEEQSEPVIVTVKPLSPPVFSTFETFLIYDDFGGVLVSYENASKADLSIVIMHKESEDYWVTDVVLYTKSESGSFAARGLESVPTIFGVYAQDRWGNVSDTLMAERTPLFESIIPKPFRAYVLPTDNTTSYNANMKMEKLWDDIIVGSTQTYNTAKGSGVPTWFTFDLGITAKLSRFLYNQRTDLELHYWGHGNPRYFEVWGTADTPDLTGSWNGWTKLMDVESVKPSGLPVGQNTDEDLALMMKGEEFNFPIDAPPVRYIRIKVNETWNKQNFIHIAELTFWGQF